MSCSRRLKPDSSTSRFAFIASHSLMSGSSSGRVDHHLFRRAVYESMGSPCCLSLLRLEEKSLLTNLLNQVVYAIRQKQSLQANVPSHAEGIPSWRLSSIFEMHSDISNGLSVRPAFVVAIAIYQAGMARHRLCVLVFTNRRKPRSPGTGRAGYAARLSLGGEVCPCSSPLLS